MTPNPNPSPELKPCPFCGGKARLFPAIIPFDADCDEVTIQCTDCDAIGANVLVNQDIHGQCDLRDLEAEAIAAWNTRVSQTLPAPGEVEAVAASASMALMYLQTGLIECPQCGEEVPTKDLDAAYELATVVQPAPSGAL